MPRQKNNRDHENFFSDVYAVARLIPAGRVTSYGAIAHYLGVKSGARMVGWAMRVCPADVPAHRVVNHQGLLTGKHHFKPPGRMQQLLVAEGIAVAHDQIIDFDKVFWDPATSLAADFS